VYQWGREGVSEPVGERVESDSQVVFASIVHRVILSQAQVEANVGAWSGN